MNMFQKQGMVFNALSTIF